MSYYQYDPYEIYIRLHGCPPPGMPKRMTYFERQALEREKAEAAAREKEQAEREAAEREAAERERAELDAARAGIAGALQARANGAGDPPPAEEAAAAPEPPADDPAPGGDASGPEPLLPAELERDSLVRQWLDEHWQALEAMALAGQAPARPRPPAPPPPTVPPHVPPGDRWTKPKMAEFLRQLAATQSPKAAAKAVGMSRQSAHRLRNRLKGQPFDIAWEAAFRHGYDNLAHSALELALEGEEVPHYYQGELVHTHRKRNPALIVQLLKMRNREGAPMLGRYGAAAEFWSESWERMIQRVETGSVTWSDEHEALGEQDRERFGLDNPTKQADGYIRRNLPDEHGRKGPRA